MRRTRLAHKTVEVCYAVNKIVEVYDTPVSEARLRLVGKGKVVPEPVHLAKPGSYLSTKPKGP